MDLQQKETMWTVPFTPQMIRMLYRVMICTVSTSLDRSYSHCRPSVVVNVVGQD